MEVLRIDQSSESMSDEHKDIIGISVGHPSACGTNVALRINMNQFSRYSNDALSQSNNSSHLQNILYSYGFCAEAAARS